MKLILTEKQYKMCLLEDVGEKYAEKTFNIKPEFSDFEGRYQRYQANENKEEIIYNDGSLIIIRNPKSLEHIGSSVRGIIDTKGNLYTEQKSKCIHHKLIRILVSKGLLNYEDEDYAWRDVLPTKFITVQRYNDTNEYEVGESHYPMRSTDERNNSLLWWKTIPSYEDAKPVFQRFIDLANRKNPHINFINEMTKLRYRL